MRTGAIIYPILSGYAGLTDLIPATRMFALRAELQTQAPYLVYREISSIPTNTNGDTIDTSSNPRINQRSILDVTRIQISVFAEDYFRVENAAVKVREALDREWGAVPTPYNNDIFTDSIVYDNCNDDFDDDYGQDGIYMKHLEFTIRVRQIYIGQTFINSYALDFDGVDDYVDCGDKDIFTPNSSGGNRGFSVSFWLKLNSGATASQQIISKNGAATQYEWKVFTRSDSKLRMVVYADDNISNFMYLEIDTALAADQWYHIAYTWDLGDTAAAWTGYIDGVKCTDGSGATFADGGTWSSVTNTGNNLYFAAEGTPVYGELKLDEVSLWDDEISEGQIELIYNGGEPVSLNLMPIVQTYLIGWWRNGDGATYPTIPDDSEFYSNAGTMTNMIAGNIITDAP
tara:strand:+ start:2647 stop:3849 length:1203 start_codon:yes stop_codon:yes gene_type:complete